MNVIVQLRRDDATRKVAMVHELLTSSEQKQALMKVVGVTGQNRIRAWFRRRDADSPNKMGWPRQHFWARLARATALDLSKTTEDKATVTVADPALSAKVYGATIRPTGALSPITGKPTQNVAIPMQGEVYGAWPRGRPVPGLFFIRKSDGNGGYLVTAQGEGKSRRLTFFYRLVPEVVVPKDPQALPPIEELGAALGETALQFFRRHGGEGNN